MRVAVDWSSSSLKNYKDFCKKHKDIKLTYVEWKDILYTFNNMFREHILETGEKVRMPNGFGEFSINKKIRSKFKYRDGEPVINLPIDWVKTHQKGKIIYNFNHHTEGYFFGWLWFKKNVSTRFSKLWYFKPSRTTSRLLSHYLKVDNKYQHIYCEWKK